MNIYQAEDFGNLLFAQQEAHQRARYAAQYERALDTCDFDLMENILQIAQEDPHLLRLIDDILNRRDDHVPLYDLRAAFERILRAIRGES